MTVFKRKPRLFKVKRWRDAKHISGIGKVIDGVVFADGQVVIQWQNNTSSISVFKNLKDFQHTHVKPIFNENEFIWYDGYEPSEEVLDALDQVAEYVMKYSGGKISNKTRGDIIGKIMAVKQHHVKQQQGGLNRSYIENVEKNKRPRP